MTASPLERFANAVQLAHDLPHPTAIYHAIMAGTRDVDDGLRAASYDGDRVSASSASSHPERMVARRNPDLFPRDDDAPPQPLRRRDGRDDLLALRRATDRALDAIAALNAECCDAGQPDTWDEAIKDAHLLHEQGYLRAAVDVGRNVDAWALRFAHAIDTVRAVHDSWLPHAPTQGLAEENHAWCRSHERIDVKRPRVTRLLCQQCWRDVQDLETLGAPVELQNDPAMWPSEAMLEAREAGRRVLFGKEQQRWLLAHGLNPADVHRRRQDRRTAC